MRAAEDVAARERKSDETASKRANASEPEAGHHGLDRPMLLDAVLLRARVQSLVVLGGTVSLLGEGKV